MSRIAWLRRLALRTAQYGAIILVTLILLDLTLMALGLFPPTYEYGEPDLGWVASPPTGLVRQDRCIEFSTGEQFRYTRNEDGVRTSLSAAELHALRGRPVVGVTGDSQTDLCAPNDQTHPGAMERELQARGVPAVAAAYGAGRYSPVQAYLAFKKRLAPYGPRAFVLNLYTGNDFNDILRVDDRPHFVWTDSGYVIAPPAWYRYDEPGVRRRSRVLFALRTLAKRTGVLGLLQRVRVLRAAAAEQGEGLGTVVAYLNDLRRSEEPTVGYSGAFSAQMLNQQLFFHRFPAGRAEAVRRVAALLALVRREQPGLVLMLSPLPSYQLVGEQPVDSALQRTIGRLPLTYEGGVREERALYDTLRVLAREAGWVFADNLAALQAYRGPERLYNAFDYHLLPVASAIIGRTQAEALAPHLRR